MLQQSCDLVVTGTLQRGFIMHALLLLLLLLLLFMVVVMHTNPARLYQRLDRSWELHAHFEPTSSNRTERLSTRMLRSSSVVG